MSGTASISIAALALSALAPLTAFAGQYSKQCTQSGNSARSACETAARSAGAADAASAGQKAATTGASANMNPGAGAQGAQISEQIARLQQAKQQCEAEKKKCEQQCDNQKQQAQADDQARKQGEPAKVEKAKNKDCIGAILPLIAEIDKGLGNLGSDAGGTNNTGQNSGSMPPIPPIPPKKDDEKKSATDDPTANKPMVCGSDSTTTRYSDCNDYYVNKCSGNMGQDGCDQFISRYCGPMNGSGSGTSTGTNASADSNFLTGTVRNPATANLVADKQGEGMGSDFCGKANGYRFCQTSGRENCPSCQSITNWSTSFSSEQLKSAQNACPSDPMFSDPSVVAQINQAETPAAPKDPDKPLDMKEASVRAAALAAGGSPGSSGQGTGAAGGKATLGNDEGIAEGVATGPGSLDLNSGSGAGGGYPSENEENSEDSKPMGIQSATVRTPAGNLVSNSSDVANQYGPNLFSISTSTYKALCQRGRFLHCRER